MGSGDSFERFGLVDVRGRRGVEEVDRRALMKRNVEVRKKIRTGAREREDEQSPVIRE